MDSEIAVVISDFVVLDRQAVFAIQHFAKA
jgi:hypothetical protein